MKQQKACAVKKPPRKQCAKCPWKTTTNPNDIPGEYSAEKHAALKGTIAEPGMLNLGGLRIMACHETGPGKELPCVGWLVHQLGPGNNIGLRMAAMSGRVDAKVRTVGPQHERFEDTLPEDTDDDIEWGDERDELPKKRGGRRG